MRGLRYGLYLTLFVALFSHISFAHETDTSEILKMLQELRDDLDEYVIPRDIDGDWRFMTDCATTQGTSYNADQDQLTWVEQVYRTLGVLPTFHMRQSGHSLAILNEGSHAGQIWGNYIFTVRSAGTSKGYVTVTGLGEFVSVSRIQFTEYLEVSTFAVSDSGEVTQEVQTETCDGELVRVSVYNVPPSQSE